MEQTVSKTFGMTLRIEVDPENEDLLAKYLDARYVRGTLHNLAAHTAKGRTNQGGSAGLVMKRANKYVLGLEVDHLNGRPGDNRLVNLEMVTSSENKKRRGKNKQHYELPPIPREGLRLYPIEITAIYDVGNIDLLGRMERSFQSGAMYRGIMSSVASWQITSIPGVTTGSLTKAVLARNGIIVPKGLTVDHINGDGGLNVRENLRVVTHSVNIANRHYFTYPAAMTA